MKKTGLTVFALFFCLAVFAGEIELSGIYQGKNIYVMNPFSQGGNGFCIIDITVNGEPIRNEINSSAFEIDLSLFNFKQGDAVEIKIRHKENCSPRVLNPEVLKPRSTFEAKTIKMEKGGNLKWVTVKESGSLPFVVEQFKWNKWVKAGEVEGKGTQGPNEYLFQVNMHSGENKFRVKQIDFSKKPRYSKELKFRSSMPEVVFSPSKPVNEIEFSAETSFEIYDNSGTLIQKGEGKRVNIASLPKGDYFLNYDSKTETFRKK